MAVNGQLLSAKLQPFSLLRISLPNGAEKEPLPKTNLSYFELEKRFGT